MFGLITLKHDWKWAAFGKHPVAGDFLKTGGVTPLLKSFSSWMEKGFSELSSNDKKTFIFSWRFWAKGPNGELICGLLKSSEDKYGRKYPLLLIGSGKVQGLLKHWDLIPYACESLWCELETIADKSLRNVKDLNRELKKINPPDTDLLILNEKSEKLQLVKMDDLGIDQKSDFMNKMNNIEGLARLTSFSVVIDIGDKQRMLVPVAKLLLLLKKRSKSEPEVVCFGGTGDENRMLCFKRTLGLEDFKLLVS